MKTAGFGQLQKQLEQASRALRALDGELAELHFNPCDATSVESAILEMRRAIDARVAPYRGNAFIEPLIADMKAKYEQQILSRAEQARNEKESQQMPVDQTVFRQIENTVNDLRRADYNAFGRHIKKLSKLLHSDELAEISDALMEGIDIEAWIEAGHKTQGGTVGSARLEWPEDPEKEMGTIILLVDRFAADPDDALQFCHTFFYAGRTVSGDFQKMTADILVPFARDFIDYVKERTGSGESALLPTREGPAARKVFVVHGHDDHARESVARFVEKIGFQAIVLHEQANQGRTIIEKIEAHGEVGFAIVLLTPDDFGGVKGADAQPRARQNVVLELGYFLGRLGRSRVCALKRGDVEVPSDYDGVVYQDFDEGGGWKAALGRELQAAGFEIDWNSVMRG